MIASNKLPIMPRFSRICARCTQIGYRNVSWEMHRKEKHLLIYPLSAIIRDTSHAIIAGTRWTDSPARTVGRHSTVNPLVSKKTSSAPMDDFAAGDRTRQRVMAAAEIDAPDSEIPRIGVGTGVEDCYHEKPCQDMKDVLMIANATDQDPEIPRAIIASTTGARDHAPETLSRQRAVDVMLVVTEDRHQCIEAATTGAEDRPRQGDVPGPQAR